MSITFGAALRHIRKTRGLTLTQVAERVGVSYPAVQQWEADRTEPSADNLKKLSNIVGAKLISLLRYIQTNGFEGGLDEEGLIGWANHLMAEFDEEQTLEREAVSKGLDPRFYRNYVWKIKHLQQERVSILEGRRPFQLSYDLLPIAETLPSIGNEDFILSGQNSDYVFRPIGMANNLRSFGIYVPDNRLSPKFEAGELIILNDNMPSATNDFAAIIKTSEGLARSGPCYLRQIISIDDEEINAFQLSPPRHDRFPRSDGYEAYRVASVSDMLSLEMKAD